MTAYLFDPLPQAALPVLGEHALYPVNRIFCVGRNYVAHAAEMGQEIDREKPFYFTKSPAALQQTQTAAPYPPGTDNFHYEMEFVVALGAPAFRVSVEEARKAVFGYASGLDMTRRDLQLSERQKQRPWSLGKDVEHSAVVGPIERAEAMGEIGDQRIWLDVNGERKQDAKLSEMVWSVDEIISHLSGFYHLNAGDLIFTGTPAGVGPVQPGDKLHGHIDGLAPVEFDITAAD